MPQYKYKVFVNADFDVVWQKLMDKVEHPEKHVEGIRHVEILEHDTDHVLRVVYFENNQWESLKELIVPDKATGMIVYRLIDHPYFEGETINTCRTTNQVYQSELEFEIHWTLKDQNATESNEDKHNAEQALQLAVQKMKTICEEAQANYT